MDSIPLSIFLDELARQNGLTKWSDALTSSSSEENSAKNAVSADSPRFPYSSPENFDNFDDETYQNQDSSSSEKGEFEIEGKTQKKRKRQEGKTKCEAKRRNRFNEQLELLRVLVSASQTPQNDKQKKQQKLTRDAVMSAAIQEILELRQGMQQMNQMLLQTQKMLSQDQSLKDPFNRASYSVQDLERAFQVMFARQLVQNYSLGNHKTTDQIVCEMKMLSDVSKQIGKAEYQLNVAIMEESFYSIVKFSLKDLQRCLDNNWIWYQDYQKTRRDTLFLLDADLGSWILNDMLLMQNAIGNLEAFETTHLYIKDYLKKSTHPGTHHFMLANLVAGFRGSFSLPLAKRINDLLDSTMWAPVGKIIFGTAFVNVNKHKEGLELIERGIAELIAFGKGEDSIHLFMVPYVLNAYVKTRSIDKGLALANYTLKKFAENQIETFLGKSEILRLKANLLILKKHLNFVPEPSTWRDSEDFVEDSVGMCEALPKLTIPKPSYGPLPYPDMLIPSKEKIEEDAKGLLQSALSLAQLQGMLIMELRCGVDLVRYFLHIGDLKQAMGAAQVVKDALARIKGSKTSGEVSRARFVVSLVDPRWLFQSQ